MSAPLLPQDRYIAEILGISEEDMIWFKAEVQKRASEAPPPLVVAGVDPATAATLATVSAILSAISIGLTIIASFFAPRPKKGGLETTQKQGTTLTSPSSFASTYGFESVQDIAPLGDPIPRIYAKREFIDGKWYGGVRVNTPLLWSQIWSLGGSQMLRAIFLLGEGRMESVHPTSFAIGNNTLGAYAFNSNRQRISVYFAKNGGRLSTQNYLSGASPSNDIGAGGQYASDIYRVDRTSDNLKPDFCGAYKPTTSTTFGVYAPIANGLGYRISPSIRPLRQLKTKQDDDTTRYVAMDDASALAEAWRNKYIYSSKTGVVSTSRGGSAGELVSLQVGDTFRVRLSGLSDGVLTPNEKPPFIRFSLENTDNVEGSQKGEETLLSVGSAVGGRQREYDSSLIEGEVYKVGSCIAILTNRSGEFISESFYGPNYSQGSENLGVEGEVVSQDLLCTFEVVRAGVVGVVGRNAVVSRFFTTQKYMPREGFEDAASIWDFNEVGTDYAAGEIGSRHYVASSFPQIFRCALASFAINRPARHFEIGIKSQLGIRINGLCNFSDVPSLLEEFEITDAEFSYPSRPAGSYGDSARTVTVPVTGGSGTGMTVTIEIQSDGSLPNTIYNEAFPVAYPYVSVANPGQGYLPDDVVTASGSAIGPVGAPSLPLTIIAISQAPTGNEIVAPGYEVINYQAANSLDSRRADKKLSNSIFQSGIISIPEKRYSFFRIGVRKRRGDSVEFLDTGDTVFGFSGSKTVSEFNFIRFAMNDTAPWEVRLEPVTSWEIRHFGLRLILIKTDLGSATPVRGYGFSWGTVYAQGERLPNRRKTFMIEQLQPQVEIGLSWTEGVFSSSDPNDGTYVDFYGRAAESFVYDEITTSCQQVPEHEIVYVNVVTPNESAPQYDNLALLGVNVKSSSEWSQFAQFSAYVTGGIIVDNMLGDRKASHLFPDVLYDILTDRLYGLGNEVATAQIDRDSFVEAAEFCQARKYFFDGAKLNDTNWRQWAADVAAVNLLLLIEKGGIFYLQRAMPRTPLIKGIFTPGNSVSIDFQSFEAEQREPFAVSIKYREEIYSLLAPPTSTDEPESYGLFPSPREVLVYSEEWGYSNIESIDVSEYCTSKEHAVDAAKFIIAARKLSDHSVKIKTTVDAVVNPLSPGDYIKVAVDRTRYEEFSNGVVLDDGTLVAGSSMADGTYKVLYWNRSNESPVVEGSLVVSGNGAKATPAGIVFTVSSTESLTRTYRIESIQPSEDGYEIDASFSPTLSNGISSIYDEWGDESKWSVVD